MSHAETTLSTSYCDSVGLCSVSSYRFWVVCAACVGSGAMKDILKSNCKRIVSPRVQLVWRLGVCWGSLKPAHSSAYMVSLSKVRSEQCRKCHFENYF